MRHRHLPSLLLWREVVEQFEEVDGDAQPYQHVKLVDYSFSSEEDYGLGTTAEDEELLDETISDTEIGIVEEDDEERDIDPDTIN